MAEAGRLVELFKEACSLTGPEQEAFVRRVRDEDAELGNSLAELLGGSSPGPTEMGSFAKKLKELHGSEADPRISLEDKSESSDFTSKVVDRLAGREEAYERYKFEGEVARGGQGAILRVWDEDIRRNLAMKVVLGKGERAKGKTSAVDSKTLGRFLEEAQVTGQLDHPGIVPVHELGLDHQGQVYFTMKLVKGRDLKAIFDLVHEGREDWTQTRALNVLLKVCEAMAYAHSKGVIHRDLKPSNIMVGRFGEVYAMDWGLARVLSREDQKDIRIQPVQMTSEVISDRHDGAGESPDSPLVTMDGDVVGTPAYMSPEQAAGEMKAMGPHSDVYAVGAMLYHLLTGQVPYVPTGARLNNYAIWALVQTKPPDPVHELAPGVPAELGAICEKAMARDLQKRYPDMKALSEDLRAFLENRVVLAYRTGAFVELKKWVQRNRSLAGALAAGIAALVLGLTVSQFQKARAEENEQLAEARRDEVLQLSTLQELDDRTAEANGLWPARPENVKAYVDWIDGVRALTAVLPLHRAKREELRSLALPRTEAERVAERRSHADYPELERLEGEVAFVKRALLKRRDGVEPELPEVDWNTLPSKPGGLNEIAWQRVDPKRDRFGEEPLALVVARRAAEKAPRNPSVLGTLAWASYALGYDEEALDASFAAVEVAKENRKDEFRRHLLELEELALPASTGAELARAEADLERLEERRAELEARVDVRRDWRFPEEEREARWWNNQLTKLIEGLEVLEAGLLAEAEDAVTAEHGWSVPRRLAFAQELERDFAAGGEHARAWAQALPSIREAYAGLELAPQLGLVPLGQDPRSGLWEFADLQTGTVPVRDAADELVLTEETGLVFVLIPGGTFAMGAQTIDRSAPGYDPDAQEHEKPLHDVSLSPFFLSKHEMTQGQWLRFTGRNPSYYGPHNYADRYNRAQLPASLTHPVERVSWDDCVEALTRLQLALPSEAQWEYATRAGTTDSWWTGADPAALARAGNLGDKWARTHGGPPKWVYESWDDGNTVHARVGSYEPNPFGLYDVVGNVAEWCLDAYQPRYYHRSPSLDPVSDAATSRFRVIRGGGYLMGAAHARSAQRAGNTPESVDTGLGVRPARSVDP